MKRLAAGLVFFVSACVVGDDGRTVVGYEDEYGIQVARYALDGVCDCDTNGIDGDCDYTYHSALECDPTQLFADQSGWDISLGYFNMYALTASYDIMCGQHITRAVYLDGELSWKFYGRSIEAAVRISDIDGASDSMGSCTTTASTRYCLVADIEPPTSHVAPYAQVTVSDDDTFVAFRLCTDSDVSDN